MGMNPFTNLMVAVIALFLFGSSAHADSRPNIVIILCDDMGYSDLGCYGSEIRTPVLDSLAADGVRYTQFHNTSKCWTTRATLLTGQYWQKIAPGKFLTRECATIPEVLKDVGYGTYMSGKWHLSPARYQDLNTTPAARGFERFYGILHGATSFFDPFTLTRGFDPIQAPRGENYYFTDSISDDAAKNIREHRKKSSDKPFFMYLAYTAPHWPMHAFEEDIAKYEGVYEIGWDELRQRRFARMKELGVISTNAKLSPQNPGAKNWDAVDRKWEARRMAVYAAMIDRMDQGIGRVVRALKETKSFDNTLILFMSDNGGSPENIGIGNAIGCLGGKAETREGEKIQVGYGPGVNPGPETTFQGYGPSWANASCSPFVWWKTMSHEGGVATPFIAHWPKGIRVKGKINSRDITHLIDLMPTCLELAQAEYPNRRDGVRIKAVDGISMVDSLTKGEPVSNRVLFNEFANKAFVRDGRWKLVTRKVPSEQWELYDLKTDPSELNDLAGREVERCERMKRLYSEWYAGTGFKPPAKKVKKSKKVKG
ncbi:MAG: arylsulfatase [Limisphaerales bacterium]|jgi:arylsulfatase A-like enzyme